MKRIVSLILILSIVLTFVPSKCEAKTYELDSVWDGSTATSFDGGSGTKTDPYRIATAEQLAYFASQVNSGTTFEGQYVVLTADIYLNDTQNYEDWGNIAPDNNWMPIGKYQSRAFKGKFDGQFCTIEGLYCSKSGLAGLFGSIYAEAEIKNLIINNAYISGTYAGGLTAYINIPKKTFATITNITFSGIITASSNYAGGICGWYDPVAGLLSEPYGCNISNCRIYGDIVGNSYVGGIVGYTDGSISIDGCYVNADIVGNGDQIGGITGSCNSSITNCAVSGSITGNKQVGGICGYSSGAEIRACTNYATIKGTTTIGGILGHAYCYPSISECINSGNISGTNHVGGILGYLNVGGQAINCYNTGIITGTGKYIGGIAGECYQNGASLNKCYNIGLVKDGKGYSVCGEAWLGANVSYCYYFEGSGTGGEGTSLTSDQMAMEASFSGFDFDSIWAMDSTKGRPVLRDNPEVDYSREEPQKLDEDEYLIQHLNFVSSNTYNTVSNDFRYAKTLWTNQHAGTGQAASEFVYSVLEGTYEAISFQDINCLENPYDAILLDLLASNEVSNSVKDAVEADAGYAISRVIDAVITSQQDPIEWIQETDIIENFKGLLNANPYTQDSKSLYFSLQKFLKDSDKSAINTFFKGFKCYDKLVSNLADGAQGVDYFLQLLKYSVAIESYYSASVEFKTILQEIAEVMPSVNKTYGDKFVEAYNNYCECVDYDAIAEKILKKARVDGAWLLADLASEVLQDMAITFCQKALKMTALEAGKLTAILWAAGTGFELGNLITNNDTLMNCRRILRANYMLDEAVHYVMNTHAERLKSSPSYEEALYFDAAFGIFKNIQIMSLQMHQKYMEANGSSILYFLLGRQDRFNEEAQAKAVIMDTWKKITCHNIDKKNAYSKAHTVVMVCPTDVYVYKKDTGTLVASVVDNQVYNIDEAVTVVSENNEKAICLPNYDDYRIDIKATDIGTMSVNCFVDALEKTTCERAVLFDNVQLNDDSVYELKLDSKGNGVMLIGEDNRVVTPYLDTANLAFKGASLSLQHNLAINYKVDKALFEDVGYTDPYVVFELNGVKTKASSYTISGDRYIFTFRNIAPDQMNDTIKATLYATYNGVEYASETREYSVAEYCYSMLELYSGDEYSELRTLLVDLLNYGAASQVFTDYKTDALVNADLTETQKQWATSNDPTLETVLDTAYATVENPSAVWKGAGLNLQESVSIRLKFTAENTEDLKVKITSSTKTWTIYSDKFIEADGVYQVYFTGLDVSQMREKVYFTIYEGDTPVSNTVCYSIGSYAYEKQNSTINGLSDLVVAMMKYGDSAYAYTH